jgi:hypothetical protein
LRTSPRSRRGGRPRKAEPAVAAAPSLLDKVRSEIFAEGKTKPCKYRGIVEGCRGTFTLTWRGAKETCDNPACKKKLRADTHAPANKRYNSDPINKDTVINPRRRRNYPAAKGRINKLRRDATYANRQLKPCVIPTIADADLPTDFLRDLFAKARKTCLGEFYPKGKTRTCSDPCSKALAKLGERKRQQRYNGSPKGKIKNNTAKKKRRAGNKAKGLAPDTPKGFREIEPRDIKCEYCGGMFKYYKPGQAPLACPKPKCQAEHNEHKKELRR